MKTTSADGDRFYKINYGQSRIPFFYPTLFEEISSHIYDPATLFLLGGEALRVKGIKEKTKDCDIITADEHSFTIIVDAINKMGYKSSFSEDLRNSAYIDFLLNAQQIPNFHPIIYLDLFNVTIFRGLYLSNMMQARAYIEYFKDLQVGILSNEDIFLMKAVSLTKNYLPDLIKIIKAGDFDWEVLWNEIIKQESDRSINLSSSILDCIYDIIRQESIYVPIYERLLIRAIDQGIIRSIKEKPTLIKEIIFYIKHDDITEPLVFERINYLEGIGIVERREMNNKSYLLFP